ncbi:MAG: 50S ribosomal protein L5 [Planctomycetes bacterium]|nr:50S ribosomal protein L5 [Planctomycetota bacterium]
MARLLEKYNKEVVPKMKEKFGYKNPMAVPKLQKITLNMGVGKAMENKNRIEHAVRDMEAISGQKPIVTRAKKAVAGFKLRENLPIGVKVTIRGKRMYEFLDRLIAVVLPRIKDFRGMPRKSFDGRGNYSFGLHEQVTFPEINLENLEFVQGMDVTLTLTGNDDEASAELLTLFGFPFRQQK